MPYISLNNLKVYQLSREYSKGAWNIYKNFNWQTKKVIGDQFIRSVDSVGANIAEGYGRYRYLDKIKFYYNARGSLLESRHWLELLRERGLTKQQECDLTINIYKNLKPGLNGLIGSNYTRKQSTTK